MDAMTRPPADPEAAAERALVLRFDVLERAVHWVTAALFLTLLATGSSLYIGQLAVLVGRRHLVRTIHVTAGLLLPVPLAVGIAGRWGRALRRDLGRLGRFAPGEWRWFRRAERPAVVLDKFNPGQKLNAAFVAGAMPVMLATGSIMKWFGPFPLAWRTGATFVHDWMFLALAVVVVGHVGKALADPDALRGMVRGTVPASWTRR